ncbi:MAG: cupin domain-containing protein [Rhodobacterales bacterium]|nr:cupin domain-containing protein [Rhodobacterales bacterium]
MTEPRATLRLPTTDLTADIGFFTRGLGMRLIAIWPADDPAVADLQGHGLRLRLDRHAPGSPGTVILQAPDPEAWPARLMTSPGGTRVEVEDLHPPVTIPATQHEFAVRRLADGAPWVVGRAGMLYRDLVPSRLGGAMIASHIRIPDGGPVPDMVHYHRVGFQLIFCLNGWVDVVYEDQGPPIRLTPGDCFIQPPEIRHRVLQASDGIEVIEIGVPAEHVTQIDHDMTLPTPHLRPDREWQGQRFVHNVAAGAAWAPHRLPGFVARDTTIAANTHDVAGVLVLRPDGGPTGPARHSGDILFTYVIRGGLDLTARGQAPVRLAAGDAFVTPPGLATHLHGATPDLELLEVALPARVPTELL